MVKDKLKIIKKYRSIQNILNNFEDFLYCRIDVDTYMENVDGNILSLLTIDKYKTIAELRYKLEIGQVEIDLERENIINDIFNIIFYAEEKSCLFENGEIDSKKFDLIVANCIDGLRKLLHKI